MKLLYAEDETAMSEAVTDILTFHKYMVDAVDNGQDALEGIRRLCAGSKNTGDYPPKGEHPFYHNLIYFRSILVYFRSFGLFQCSMSPSGCRMGSPPRL